MQKTMDQSTLSRISELRAYFDEHINVGRCVIKADFPHLFALDLLMFAALNRSACLLRGFCDLLESRNFVCAAPLIRLQLDNCLRVMASSMVTDPHKFSRSVLEGTPIRQMTDRKGRNFTDQYLVKTLAADHPWIEDVYSATSSYIHLSERHMANAIRPQPGGEGIVTLKVTAQDFELDPAIYENAVDVFQKLTDILLSFVGQWANQKDVAGRAFASYPRLTSDTS